MMHTHDPWTIYVGKRNYLDEVGKHGLLDEVMQHPDIMKDVKVGSLRISDRYAEFRKCWNFIDHYLKADLKEHLGKEYQYEPEKITWSAWVHTCLHGQGLVPHYHMGDEHFTSILYLTESKADLVLRNPLANTMRSWPQEMVANQFADQHIQPRVGDFVLFPTFIDHYVMAAEPDFRVSIAIDWCFK